MSAISVTSKGQVTIPVSVRKSLGITPGTKVTFTAKNGFAHMVVIDQREHSTLDEGAGMLKISGAADKKRSLLDFDAADMVKRRS